MRSGPAPERDPVLFAALIYLRTIDELRMPVIDDYVTLEQLREAASAHDESWTVSILEREKWVRHALGRLQRGAVEHGNCSFARPLAELFDDLSDRAADLGAWSAIAHQAMSDRSVDLEVDERELIAQALRDAAVAGAQAWARIDQARAILRAATDRGHFVSAMADRH
jgi:hypothetical protein